MKKTLHKAQTERGVTLMEMLVVLVLAGLIFWGLMTQYSRSSTTAYDQNIKISTVLEAQAMLQSVGSEIRMLGNGVPFDQANFRIGENTLTDPTVTEPIQLATAAANTITFRLNETGDVFLLTADFDPAVNTTVSLTDVSTLDANDPIYMSNSVVAEEDGFYAIIQSVNTGANTITLDAATYVYSPGATFAKGSILEEVPLVTYSQDASGINRNSGFGSVLMGPNSTMTLEYLDEAGNAVALPLTTVSIVDSLRAIRVTISHDSSNALSDGTPFTAVARQTYGIRNLNYLY